MPFSAVTQTILTESPTSYEHLECPSPSGEDVACSPLEPQWNLHVQRQSTFCIVGHRNREGHSLHALSGGSPGRPQRRRIGRLRSGCHRCLLLDFLDFRRTWIQPQSCFRSASRALAFHVVFYGRGASFSEGKMVPPRHSFSHTWCLVLNLV